MKEKYLNARAALLAEAQKLLDEGKTAEATAKTKEIEALDNQHEADCKAAANLAALAGNPKIVDIAGKQPGSVLATTAQTAEAEDMYDSLEYRKAFMSNVLHNKPIPGKFTNIDENTKTSDVGTVIPTTIVQRIVEKMESTGMILPLVTKTAYQGGVAIPTSTVKPTATWVLEGAGSDKQKKTTSSITFGRFKLRCAISMSLETSVTTLGVFETSFVNNVSEAMTKALESAIVVDGDGATKPKAILAETVVVGQNVDIAAAKKPEYSTLLQAEAALPLAYESGAVWCMTKKTFMEFYGMLDAEGQPIGRINYGIGGKPERMLLGRTVVLNDYMSSYADTVASDTIVAFLFNFSDYCLNTNYAITVKRYEDNDTDDQIMKAVMLVDGKVVDKNSLVTVTKKH